MNSHYFIILTKTVNLGIISFKNRWCNFTWWSESLTVPRQNRWRSQDIQNRWWNQACLLWWKTEKETQQVLERIDFPTTIFRKLRHQESGARAGEGVALENCCYLVQSGKLKRRGNVWSLGPHSKLFPSHNKSWQVIFYASWYILRKVSFYIFLRQSHGVWKSHKKSHFEWTKIN